MAASAYGTGKCAKKCTNFALLNKCIWQYAVEIYDTRVWHLRILVTHTILNICQIVMYWEYEKCNSVKNLQ